MENVETEMISSVDQARTLTHEEARKQLPLIDAARDVERKRNVAKQQELAELRTVIVQRIGETERERIHLVSESTKAELEPKKSCRKCGSAAVVRVSLTELCCNQCGEQWTEEAGAARA
jgi:ribosomal protein L37AE/L43A